MTFPSEMTEASRWVCWKYAERNGKRTKVPINAKTGREASSTDPETWADYKAAQAVSGEFDGIGFVLGDGWFGIDLDHVEGDIEEYRAGKEDNIVSEFIDTMESYSEYSPSGTGIHIICRGELPPGGRKAGDIEMYDSGRYFTITGNRAADYDLRDGTEAVKPLHAKYFGKRREAVHTVQAPEKRSEIDILEAINHSKSAEAFGQLYRGSWEGLYPSQSNADQALCNHLAFWTGNDPAMMDIMFRHSGLMRKKWDEKRGKLTYGERTIQTAIDSTTEIYKPKDDYSVIIRNPDQLPDRRMPNFPFDDTGNGQRIAWLCKSFLRYSYVDKCWYFYDGHVWCRDEIGQAKSYADDMITMMEHQEVTEDIEKAFQKHVKHTRSSSGKEAALKEAQHLLYIVPKDMDRDGMKLNTPDGVVDLKSGEIIKNNPEFYMTRMTGVEYSPHVSCTRWRQFISEIFDGDEELINFVHKAVGYSMVGSTEEQMVFFCYGEGQNGKSVFLDVLSEIMGSYAVNIQPETIMVKRSGGGSGANSDIARLKGARFVTTSEPDEGARLSEGIVKQLSGGDKVTARKLYGNEFEFSPELKLWMATNHKPVIRGTDKGIWRRIAMIPFNVTFTNPDKKLIHKLRAEASAILGWMIEGCIKWQHEGLEKPKAVTDANQEYRNEMDVIERFLESGYVTTGNNESCAAMVIFARYQEYASQTDEFSMSMTKFGTELSKRFEKIKDSSGKIVYKGIGVSNKIILPN